MRRALPWYLAIILFSLPGCLVSYSSESSERSGEAERDANVAAARANAREKEIAALREENDRLREIAEELREICENYVGKGEWKRLQHLIKVPEIAAKITSVDKKHNVVVLSAGADDRVRPGYEFTVHRGDTYVGKVVVTRVDRKFSIGYSRLELQSKPLKVGDTIRTRW